MSAMDGGRLGGGVIISKIYCFLNIAVLKLAHNVLQLYEINKLIIHHYLKTSIKKSTPGRVNSTLTTSQTLVDYNYNQ